jgi:arsenate reductase
LLLMSGGPGTPARPYHVLVLCTGNSARSIMAEALINTMGGGRFLAWSAGSRPSGAVHPLAAAQALSIGYPADRLRSKSWDEFAGREAPPMDFVITVCDNAAAEVCPVWPGHPVTAHWGFADPAAFVGSEAEKRRVFEKTFHEIMNRVQLFVNLPLHVLDATATRREMDAIGRTGLATA